MLTLCFDIDGVVCEAGSFADYSRAVPYQQGIDEVNAAYARGHYIVFQTARGMRQFNGNVSLCYAHLYGITYDWLKRHLVQFHELHFGKPSADIYPDDRGCRVRSAKGITDWNNSFWPLLTRAEHAGHGQVN